MRLGGKKAGAMGRGVKLFRHRRMDERRVSAYGPGSRTAVVVGDVDRTRPGAW
jgi:hypothetical protein